MGLSRATIYSLLAAWLACIGPIVGLLSAQNLVVNGSFDADADGWALIGHNHANWQPPVTGNAIEGGVGHRGGWFYVNDVFGAVPETSQLVVGLEQGRPYRISGYCRRHSLDYPNAKMQVFTDSTLRAELTGALVGSWTHFEFEFTASSSSTLLRFRSQVNGDDAWGIDEIRLEKWPPDRSTTVVTHGFTIGEKGAWVEGMAVALAERIITEAAPTSAVIYRYDPADGYWIREYGSHGAPHAVLIFNWTAESDALNDYRPNWRFAEAAAESLYASLRDPRFKDASGSLIPTPLLGDRAMHFIGHSRGCSVNSETVRRLAVVGYPVEHVTTLDPHPVNGSLDACVLGFEDWGDPVPVKWSNTVWADNYWRADDNACDFDGIPLAAPVFDDPLDETTIDCDSCGYPGGHSNVHMWYHGTVDPIAMSDGEKAFTQEINNTWWTDPNPSPRHAVGWERSIYGSEGHSTPSSQQSAGRSARAPIVPFNGHFEQGSEAGWAYHGGAEVPDGGDVLSLVPPSGGELDVWNNRWFRPRFGSTLFFDYRVVTPFTSPVKFLEVWVNSASSPMTILLGGTTPWTRVSYPLGGTVNRSSQVEFFAGFGPGAVEIDNVRVDAPFVEWNFDAGANETTGRSGYNGAFVGTAGVSTSTLPPAPGSQGCLVLNGPPSYVSVPRFTCGTMPKGTLELWARPTTLTTTLFNHGTAAQHTDLAVWMTGGGVQLWINNGGGPVVATPELTANTWHHLAFTWDGSFHEVYLDGKRKSRVANTRVPLFSGNSCQIGADDQFGSTYFVGRLDEVRIHPRVLSADELADGAFTSSTSWPPTPPDPTAGAVSCAGATLTRVGSPPEGVTWHWQGTSCGTSMVLGSGATFNASTGGTYYLRAFDAFTGCWSDSCGSVTVTGAEGPGPFSLQSPSSGQSNVPLKPTFAWTQSASQCSVLYLLKVDDDPNFGSPEISVGTSLLSYTPSGSPLSYGRTYYWRVSATNGLGTRDSTPSVGTFSTLAAPVLPGPCSLLTPADGAVVATLTPTLQWTSSANATAYRVIVDDTLTLASPVIDQPGIGSTSFAVPSGVLANDGRYYWRVIASNSSGQTTATPATASFGVLIEPCIGDANGDLVVDFDDIVAILANWLTAGPLGDSNHDGSVNFSDVIATLAHWQDQCP